MLITICDDKNALGEQAAARGGWLIRKAIAERGECNVAFVTGTSQVATLKALALESKIDWTKVNVFGTIVHFLFSASINKIYKQI